MGLVHGDVEFLKGFLLGIESSQFSDEEEPVWKDLCKLLPPLFLDFFDRETTVENPQLLEAIHCYACTNDVY